LIEKADALRKTSPGGHPHQCIVQSAPHHPDWGTRAGSADLKLLGAESGYAVLNIKDHTHLLAQKNNSRWWNCDIESDNRDYRQGCGCHLP
jgi:hypothetical protein